MRAMRPRWPGSLPPSSARAGTRCRCWSPTGNSGGWWSRISLRRGLADRFWPGALTIVCRRAPGIPPALVGGGDAIGVRQPALPVAVGLCRAFGGPVVGTSANVHTNPAPITATQVALDLAAEVNLILDGGRCPLARPSTVVDVTRTPPVVVRAGVVTLAALREVLGAVAAR